MSFGQRLVEARKNLGITQKGLAEAIGISAVRLNYWEKDKRQPDVEMIKKLASVLGVSGDYLIGNEEPRPLSDAAQAFGADFDRLDEHGKSVVIAVLELELRRIAGENNNQQ